MRGFYFNLIMRKTEKLVNAELGISEDDIRICRDLETLYSWKQDLRKQLAAHNGKIKVAESSSTQIEDDSYVRRLYGYKTILKLITQLIVDQISSVKSSNAAAFDRLLLQNLKEVTPDGTLEQILSETKLEFEASNLLANELLVQSNKSETINEEELRSFSRRL